MGLCRSRPLVADALSRSIATRQTEAYRRSPELRARLAVGQEFSRTGRHATLARTARTASASPESARIRRAALDAGPMTRAAQRDRALARRLRELGFDDLAGYLHHAYSAGTSLRSLAKVTGLGWARLRREIDAALDQLAEARESDQLATANMLEKNLAFNLGGHVNHTVFWPNMSPDGGDKPDGELAAAIDEQFGAFDGFRKHFTANALGVQGSGWSILAWESLGQRLVLEQLYDHQGNLTAGTMPLLLLGMWEHAFYLQYRNVKADYVEAWWNVANWADVARRFSHARSVVLP